MITIDFSNPAQMACLSFAVALVIGISFIGGCVVGSETDKGGLDQVLPYTTVIGFFLCCVAGVANILILIRQHL